MKLIYFGDERLIKQSEEVTPEYLQSKEFNDVIKELLSIHKKSGAVGIAAPQIGVNKQIIVIGATENTVRKIDFDFPVQILVNPKITFSINSEMEEGIEGCLSLPGIVIDVPRYVSISVNALDVGGSPVCFQATGLKARVIQHEIDHLNGINFVSLSKNFRSLKFLKDLMEKICSL